MLSSVKETLGGGRGSLLRACCPEGCGTKRKEFKTVTSRLMPRKDFARSRTPTVGFILATQRCPWHDKMWTLLCPRLLPLSTGQEGLTGGAGGATGRLDPKGDGKPLVFTGQ